MPLWSKKDLSVDEVLSQIKASSEEIRREARQVSQSHHRIDEIADRLDSLHSRLLGEVEADG